VKKVQLSKQNQHTCLKLDNSERKGIRKTKTELNISISELDSCNYLKEESSSSESDTIEQVNTNLNSNEKCCVQRCFVNSFIIDCEKISESTVFGKNNNPNNSVRSQIEKPFDDVQGHEIGPAHNDRTETYCTMTHSLPFANFDEWEDTYDLVLSIDTALSEIQANEVEYLPMDFLSNTSISFDSPEICRQVLVDPGTNTCTQNDERLHACKSSSPDPFLRLIDETLGPLRCDEKSEEIIEY
jgi:hypothetical protein